MVSSIIGTRSGSILVNALTVLLVRADPLLVKVCGHGHLDGVEHQVDLASSRDHVGPEWIGVNAISIFST